MIARLALAEAATMIFGSPASVDYYIIQEKTVKAMQGGGNPAEGDNLAPIGPLSFKTHQEADKQVTVVCKEKPSQ